MPSLMSGFVNTAKTFCKGIIDFRFKTFDESESPDRSQQGFAYCISETFDRRKGVASRRDFALHDKFRSPRSDLRGRFLWRRPGLGASIPSLLLSLPSNGKGTRFRG